MLQVQVEGLTKRFDNNEILKGVSLAVDKGEVVCIIGPSGSGKTTFLRCLNLLEQPDEGSYALGRRYAATSVISAATPAGKWPCTRPWCSRPTSCSSI